MKPLRKEAKKLTDMLWEARITLAGKTPDHSTEEIRRTKKFSLVKAEEILCWLKQHSDVERWIVLDDLDLYSEEIAKHQIRTDPLVGLTGEDVKEWERIWNSHDLFA